MNRSLRFLPFIISAFIGLVACQSAGTTPAEKPKDTVAMKANTGTFFDHLLVDNRKDPSCGMPVTAGIHERRIIKRMCSVFVRRNARKLSRRILNCCWPRLISKRNSSSERKQLICGNLCNLWLKQNHRLHRLPQIFF
jgi:hypothetical protein